MPETMSPREKVARIIDPAAFLFTADELMKGDPSQFNALAKADQIFAALASSGDHAKLVRLAEAATPGPWFRGHNEHGSSQGEMSVWPDAGMVGGVIAKCGWQAPWDGWFDQPAKDAAFIAAANPATVLALIAEVAALREDLNRKHEACQIAQDQAMENGSRAREAERKLAEAVRLLRRIDRTYADMQDGNGNHPTELRKVRAFLSKEAERG